MMSDTTSRFRRTFEPMFLAVALVATALVVPTSAAALWTDGPAAADRIDTVDSPYAQLARDVGPAVVTILVSYDDDDLPPHAREMIPGPTPEHMGEGSGFIINADGHIVTNYHVIEGAKNITVKNTEGDEFDARVIGGDPMTDIALVKIEADEQLPTVPLGDSASVSVGDYVIAIGHPLGLTHSVTAGIVSALDRRDLPIEGREHQGNFIQVDAPINPGNSGGPLLDMHGEVIGINTAINRQGQGISFAIPVDLLKTLLPQLEDQGYVDRSWLGVRIQQLDPLLAESFGIADTQGALVTEVIDDSPADQAGLKRRDVITGVDDFDIADSEALPLRVSTTAEGTEVALHVVRDGETKQVPVTLESLPDQERPDLPEVEPRASSTNDTPVGLEVEKMTARYSRQLDAPEDAGVVVTSLDDDSPARHAGVRDRDVILQVGDTDVDSEDQFQQALDDIDDGSVVRFKLLRDGQTVYKAFTK